MPSPRHGGVRTCPAARGHAVRANSRGRGLAAERVCDDMDPSFFARRTRPGISAGPSRIVRDSGANPRSGGTGRSPRRPPLRRFVRRPGRSRNRRPEAAARRSAEPDQAGARPIVAPSWPSQAGPVGRRHARRDGDRRRPAGTILGRSPPPSAPARTAKAGRTNSRKPTSPLTGFPGRPKTSDGGPPSPPGSDPEPERLARLDPTLWKTAFDAQRLEGFGHEVALPGRDAAGDQEDVGPIMARSPARALAKVSRSPRGDLGRSASDGPSRHAPRQAASIAVFELRIWPGPGTSRLGPARRPVGDRDDRPRPDAGLRRRRPTPAGRAWPACSGRRQRATTSPAASRGPRSSRFWPGVDRGVDEHDVRPLPASIFSTMTTASAPSGRGAPVMIGRGLAGAERSRRHPCRRVISSTTRSRTPGSSRSAERTA